MSARSLFHILIQFACLIFLAMKGKAIPTMLYYLPAALSMAFILWSIFFAGIFNINVQPEVKANARLITHGPFRYVRHPIYSGIMLYTLFICLESPAEWELWLTWLVLIVNFDMKARFEEKLLLLKFSSYGEYKRNTSRFAPFIY